MKVGLLGYGTIGKGIKKVIENIKDSYDVRLKYVLDLPIKKEELKELLVSDINVILMDQEIEVVFEALGGNNFAYECVKKCLKNKKSVITANKEIVSLYLEELTNIAKENGVYFLYEASVGGGIPIINNLFNNKKANKINCIYGILNGTTNYLLTKMQDENYSFDEALNKAKENGFAEADPTADLEGFDIVRKINILSMIAYEGNIKNDDIYSYGLSKINKSIINDIKSKGMVLKYLAYSRFDGVNATIRVEPVLVDKMHFLANVKDEFNTICFFGETNGLLEFQGKGAGSLPTATACVSDLISIIEKSNHNYYYNKHNIKVNKTNICATYYVYNNGKSAILKDLTDDELKEHDFYAKII